MNTGWGRERGPVVWGSFGTPVGCMLGSITGKRNVVAWNVGKVNRAQAEGHPCDLKLL